MLSREQDKCAPELAEFEQVIAIPVFQEFCAYMGEHHGGKASMEFSRCSWEPGWHIKFKRSGKTLCTVYPRAGFFGVMVVIGPKQKQAEEMSLPRLSPRMRALYENTREGNGQRWLLVDVKGKDQVYEDVCTLVELRCENL